jgi:hypothetical protein
MALSFIMVLCLLVYRLAEVRLRARLVETRAFHSRSSPQADSTSYHAALVFQCFEGIELLHVRTALTSRILILRLQPLHRLILHLLGPPYEKCYFLSG